MSIEEELRKQLTAAIKAKDLRTADVIRMVNTEVMKRRTAAGFSGQVDDALHVDVISAYKKSMEKARPQYEAAGERGREHLDQIDFETRFLDQFLPKGLSEDQVRDAVMTAIAETGATDVKAVGKVVGAVMKKHKGQVDAAQVKDLATAALTPK
jgi:uncharacterized protein YqeY